MADVAEWIMLGANINPSSSSSSSSSRMDEWMDGWMDERIKQ